jgi:hypothetical protein
MRTVAIIGWVIALELSLSLCGNFVLIAGYLSNIESKLGPALDVRLHGRVPPAVVSSAQQVLSMSTGVSFGSGF